VAKQTSERLAVCKSRITHSAVLTCADRLRTACFNGRCICNVCAGARQPGRNPCAARAPQERRGQDVIRLAGASINGWQHQ
jgi:hypothetical protein